MNILSPRFALTLTLCSLGAAALVPSTPSAQSLSVAKAYGNLPIAFEPNRGQAANGVDFVARGADYQILLQPNGSDFLLRDKDGDRTQTISVRLLGSAKTQAQASDELGGRVNYLRGERSKWIVDMPTYGRVRYNEVYPATDLVYYGDHGRLEYDFVVHPGGDAQAIGFRVSAKSTRLLANGDLVLHGENSDVVWHKPVAYQEHAGKKVPVAARYEVSGDSVRFKVGAYDRKRTLVIDPALAYSTYLGGSATDNLASVAVDASGNAYVTGSTLSADFPTTAGAYDRTCGSDGACNPGSEGAARDIFVTKMNASGTGLVYSTYLGGSSYDWTYGIAVDGSGNAVVVGTTFSTDFATKSLGPSDRDTAFAAKLNATGSALVYAVRFGGSVCENGSGATAVRADSAGNAYVVGSTDCSDFGVTPGAFQKVYGGADPGTGGDAFIAKINPTGSGFVYASYLGGSQRDQATDVALDANNNAYVSGWTSSTNFPVSSSAYKKTIPSHPADLTPTSSFVSKVNATGSALSYSTYLGGSNWDIADAIAVGGDNAFVTGYAESSDYPTTTGAIQRTKKGLTDVFVTRLNSTGSGLVYSTLLGGTSTEQGTGVVVNSSGNAYVSGLTYSSDFPTTVYGFQRTQLVKGGEDAFVAELSPDGKALSYSSYLGGSDYEANQDLVRIAIDSSRNVYVAGWTQSTDFPVTPGAYRTTMKSPHIADGFIAKIVPICGVGTTNPSVTICKPASNAKVKSPVEIMAGTYDLTPVAVTQVFVDGKKVYEAHLSSLDVKLPMTTGTHRLTVQAVDVKNVVFKKTVYITVAP